MITLHHLEQSRSIRIIWALEELGLDYNIQHYKRLPNFSAPPALKKIHPLGKAPVLTDGELNIAESAVILEYLQMTYDNQNQFKPQDSKQALQYSYWMHYAEGSLMPLLVFNLVLTNVPKHVPFVIKPIARKITEGIKAGFIKPRLADHIPYLEKYLSEHEYFAGEFSFADIQMSFAIVALQERIKGKYPKLKAYAERIQQRPAYQRAKVKSDQVS